MLQLELRKIKSALLQITSINKSISKTSKNKNSVENISLFFIFQEFFISFLGILTKFLELWQNFRIFQDFPGEYIFLELFQKSTNPEIYI